MRHDIIIKFFFIIMRISNLILVTSSQHLYRMFLQYSEIVILTSFLCKICKCYRCPHKANLNTDSEETHEIRKITFKTNY